MKRALVIAVTACGGARAPAPEPVEVAAPGPAVLASPPGAAPQAPIAAGPHVTILAQVPAWELIAVADRMIVVDEAFVSTTAYDATAGALSWTRQVERDARGRHTIYADGLHAIEWAGPQLLVLDGASGALLASRETTYNGEPWDRGGCGLDVERGMCAQRCQCSYHVFDCATLEPRGAYRKLYMELFAPGAAPSAGCWTKSDATIGRAGDLALFSTNAQGDKPGGELDITAAIDLTKGTEAWRAPVGSHALPERTSFSPDGTTCWFTAEQSERLSVRDCASGVELWHTDARGGVQLTDVHVVALVVDARGARSLFEQRGRTATLYEERTGRRRWSKALPEGALAWPRGTDAPIASYLDAVSSIAILDPSTGEPLGPLAPRAATAPIVADHAGGAYILQPTELVHVGADSQIAGRAPLAASSVTLGPDLLASQTADGLVFLALDDLRELGRLPGAYSKVIVETNLGVARIAALAQSGPVVGRAVLAKLDVSP